MSAALKIAAYFIFLIAAGFVVWDIFVRPGCVLNGFRIALFFGVGMVAVSLGMLLLGLLDITFKLEYIILPWCALFFWAAYKRVVNRQALQFEWPKPRLGPLKIAVLVCLVLLGLAALVELFTRPLMGWDALASYNYKARIFYIDGGLNWGLFLDKIKIFFPLEYPLGVPLSETLFYLFLGRFDEVLVKLFFFAFLPCLACVLHRFIGLVAGAKAALIGVFCFATIPFTINVASGWFSGYADLIFAFFDFLSVAYLFLWLVDEKEDKFFYLSSLFTGLAFWVKLNGLILLLANLVTILACRLIAKRRLEARRIVLYAAIAGIFFLPALFMIIAAGGCHHFPGGGINEIVRTAVMRMPQTAGYLAAAMGNIYYWHIFWPLFFISFLRFKISGRGYLLPLYLNLFIQCALVFLAVIFNRHFPVALFYSLARNLLHVLPLALTIFLLHLAPAISAKEEIAGRADEMI